MDKAEYREKLEQLTALKEAGDFENAQSIADEIDWRRVKSARTLCMVSEIYEVNGQLGECRRLLELAYKRAIVKTVVYRLVEVCLKLEDYEAAEEYYQDFVDLSPTDSSKYVLSYLLSRAKGEDISKQIELLETYKEKEHTEQWAYELAKLYSEAGNKNACVDTCDDLILWFSEGPYVLKAMELKKKYAALTPSQQIKYELELEEAEAQAKLDAIVKKTVEKEVKASESVQEESAQPKAQILESEQKEAEREDASEEDIPAIRTEEAIEKMDAAANTTVQSDSGVKFAHGKGKGIDLKAVVDPVRMQSQLADSIRNVFAEIGSRSSAFFEKEEDDYEESYEEAYSEDDDMSDYEIKELEPEMTPQEEEEAAEVVVDAPVVSQEEAVVDVPAADQEESSEKEVSEEAIADGDAIVQDALKSIFADIKIFAKELEEKDIDAEESVSEENNVEETEIEAVKIEDILNKEVEAETAANENIDVENSAAEEDDVQEYHMSQEEYDKKMEEFDFEALFAETTNFLAMELASGNFAKTDDSMDKADESVKAVEPETKESVIEIKDEQEAESEEKTEEVLQEEEPVQYGRETDESLGLTREFNFKEELKKAMAAGNEDEVVEAPAFILNQDYEEDIDGGSLADELEALFAKNENQLKEDEDWEKSLSSAFESITKEESDDVKELNLETDMFFMSDENTDEVSVEEEKDEISEEVSEEVLEEAEVPEEEPEEVLEEAEDPEEEPEEVLEEAEVPEEEPEKVLEEAEVPEEEPEEVLEEAEVPEEEPEEVFEEAEVKEIPEEEPAQEGKILRYVPVESRELTEEEKEIFTYFAGIPGLSQQITETICDVHNNSGDKTSRSGNFLLIGRQGAGKTRLYESMVLAICKDLDIKTVKNAKIIAKDFNQKDPAAVVAKLAGGFLVIEGAGELSDEAAEKLSQAMEFRTDSLIVVLEDEKADLYKMLEKHPNLAKKFTSTIKIPVFTNDELVTFARIYAQEQGYKIDEMGILALYTKIADNQKDAEPVTVGKVKAMMDAAMLHANKGHRKLSRRFSKNAVDEENRIILFEKDFE